MSKLEERISALRAKLETLEEEKKEKERMARIADRQRVRKAENRRKFELGGLLQAAGLFNCDKGALLGALLSVKPMLIEPEKFASLKQAGDVFLAQRERERKESDQKKQTDDSYLQ